MSGGVDSSVAAALVKEQGYETIGVTLNLATARSTEAMRTGIESAREVAHQLRIPHHVLDLRQEFEQRIIRVFCQEYCSGRTPNPCVLCNKEIKLGLLLSEARNLGADQVATGHYARVVYHQKKERYLLKKGKDEQKEQSYFLFLLSQGQLASVMFPLGEMKKSAVRARAKQQGLSVYDRRGSQEVCFIPDNDYVAYIKGMMPHIEQPGRIISTSGKVLGTHQGIYSFTIGQRKRLNVPQGYPVYVVGLDNETNTVVVGKKDETLRTELTASSLNWIARKSLEETIEVTARIRYRNREHSARIIPVSEDSVKVEFFEPQLAITPGQAVVFYDGDTVVGGGWID